MSDQVSSIIGERLRGLRQDRRQSQSDIAELVAVAGIRWDQTTVSRIESGRRSIKPREIAALCELMDIATVLLVGELHACHSYADIA